jgi:hypothetical protein
MNIPFWFFFSLTVAIIGLIVAVINVATALGQTNNLTRVFVIHIVAAFFYALGSFGVLAFGIAWIVTYLKH